MSYYKTEDVKIAAEGNWLDIIAALAPHAVESIKKGTRHSACPVHGGKDGFRFFRDAHLTGGGICNTCGPFNNGFSLLMWLNDWDFKEMLFAVGDFMQVDKVESVRKHSGQKLSRPAPLQKNSIKHNASTQKAVAVSAANYTDAKNGFADSCVNSSSAMSTEGRNFQEGQSRSTEDTCSNVVPMVKEPEPWLVDIKAQFSKSFQDEADYSNGLPRKIHDLWSKSFSLNSSVSKPLRLYLKKRGLVFRSSMKVSDGDMRFIPNLEYHEKNEKGYYEKVGEYPAMLCAIRDYEGNIVTLHRTYITRKGLKAKVASPRKMMSIPNDLTINGAAIRLGMDHEGVLGVAEGLETALSAYRATNIPVWSTVNARLMESFEVPKGVHTVLIWADNDRSLTGERSANVLASRLKEDGIETITLIPQMPIPKRAKSVDWNDVLIKQGLIGFPDYQRLKTLIDRKAM